MQISPPLYPMPPTAVYNYLGLVEEEMMEFHQLISNGVPEHEAVRTIQYGRILRPPITSHQYSYPHQPEAASYLPQPEESYPLSEEEQIYRIMMQDSIEEEKRRQERLQGDSVIDDRYKHTGLSTEEALFIALQQSQDEYERVKRSQSASMSPRQPPQQRLALTRSQIMDIERVNEEAMRRAITLSMQEANVNNVSVYHQMHQQVSVYIFIYLFVYSSYSSCIL